jgi:nitrite reductase/ring-hydroxylating ferredoxin subunit
MKPVAQVKDLDEPGSRVITEVEGLDIALFNFEGDIYAVLNYCVHEGGPLCEGKLTGTFGAEEDKYNFKYDDSEKIIHCPWHDWQFDITTGENIRDPQYNVPTFETEIRDGEVYISL